MGCYGAIVKADLRGSFARGRASQRAPTVGFDRFTCQADVGAAAIKLTGNAQTGNWNTAHSTGNRPQNEGTGLMPRHACLLTCWAPRRFNILFVTSWFSGVEDQPLV